MKLLFRQRENDMRIIFNKKTENTFSTNVKNKIVGEIPHTIDATIAWDIRKYLHDTDIIHLF